MLAGSGVENKHKPQSLTLYDSGAGKTLAATRQEPKGAPWKIALAAHLRSTTTATNPWLANTLHMGAPAALSRYVTECRTGRRREAQRWHAKISKS